METDNIFIAFGTSLVIGALIGLEREKRKAEMEGQSAFGIRTAILVSLFGAISAFLGKEQSPYFFIFGLIAILLFTFSSHWYLMKKYSRIGITTEVSQLLVFIFGAMCMIGYMQLAIILGIVTAGILTVRQSIHKAITKINYQELYDTIKFAIIAFIVLPLLPQQNFDDQVFGFFIKDQQTKIALSELNVLNPYNIWFLIVLVSGISFVGYILVKYLGKKRGIGFAGLLGGLYSSTATSLTLASKSKELLKTTTPFVTGIVLACGISYIRTFIEVRALNEELFFRTMLPIGLMFIYMMAVGLYLFLTSKEKTKESALRTEEDGKNFQTPFKLSKAIKLGGFIVAALLIAKISLSMAGIEWYYLISMAMAFFAIDDPIVISTSASAGTLINFEEAKNIVLLVVYLNMVQKVAIMYFFGNRKLIKKLAAVFGGLLLVTLAGIFYL
jgi:uncharacterized membrane protein (DUF4010 family)